MCICIFCECFNIPRDFGQDLLNRPLRPQNLKWVRAREWNHSLEAIFTRECADPFWVLGPEVSVQKVLFSIS